jgi:phosphate transport system substrate-binding protein
MGQLSAGKRLVMVLVLSAALITAGCAGGKESAPPGSGTGTGEPQKVVLNGAGASFPFPIYSLWFTEYNKLHPNIQINYQSIGSGGGQKAIIEKTVDFGASDAPMTDEKLKEAPGKLLHIPTVMGAVVLTYNLPGVGTGLRLTPEVIAGVYLGKIKKWNDPAMTRENPGAKLPGKDIVVVHRSDGSGTTNIFTAYLSAVSPEWKSRVGSGTSVGWPTGVGAKGNEGVTTQVQQTEGAIGYVELAYAVENKLGYALVKNRAGKFVEPSIDSVTAAAGAAQNIPEDYRIMIVDQPGDNAYPISGFTWLLIYAQQSDLAKGRALLELLQWALTDGENMVSRLLYAPLPANVQDMVQKTLKTVTYQGQPILK